MAKGPSKKEFHFDGFHKMFSAMKTAIATRRDNPNPDKPEPIRNKV